MKNISRRRFIHHSAVGATGLALMPILQGFRPGPNDTVRLGFIGLGQQAMNLLNGMSRIPGVDVVAGADLYGIKRERFEQRVKEYAKANNKKASVTTYSDYRKVLDRNDVDAVVIATPDHWHAMIAIAACRAGKDIYQEKPITFTIKEGIKVAEEVRKNNVIFATGSQQRSDSNYQHAVNMVHREAIGKLEKVWAYVGPGPDPYDLPEQPVPKDLDWRTWIGPLPYIHYNERLNPPISLRPVKNETYWGAWRYYKETGGGYTCDWGAHNFDIGQWGLGKDHSGPVKIIPPGYQDTQYLTYVYDNGIEMINQPYDDKKTLGIKFWGSDGWISVSRGQIDASDPSLLPPAGEKPDPGLYERSSSHVENFIHAVKTRRDPVAPVEVGMRTCTACILGNIAIELARPVYWSPEVQYFINDPEAEVHFHREYHNGYQL
ncbi:MAG TPA: Gfo/Idh/MocA family oxidoreductase [Bacteroidales bacterium]|nr:Gfo/Idh/MocA family oxidoreductase [Bacteroidales bacterium]HPR74429.1 Gfo/Idh/MocA family oxidoreductase [Bacteroidales bacterium]